MTIIFLNNNYINIVTSITTTKSLLKDASFLALLTSVNNYEEKWMDNGA